MNIKIRQVIEINDWNEFVLEFKKRLLEHKEPEEFVNTAVETLFNMTKK